MKRVAGLDIVRTIAIISVIMVHFLLNTNFYNLKMDGYGMIVLSVMRHILLICVPLFLMLTGYLNKNKKLNKEYYRGVKKVLSSYFFICLICILVRIFYFEEERNILYWLISPFNYSANGYSWYIEMYLGLFLLIPFLNILYNSLENKNQKQTLIFTLLILTSFNTIFSGYKISGNIIQVLPDYWESIYPITYYFIGAYIAEFKPKIKTSKAILYIGIVLIIQTCTNYFLNTGTTFTKNIFGRYWNPLTIIISIIVFLLFYDKDIQNNKIKKLVTSISTLSLDMYLFSYIVDLIVYKYIKPIAETPKEMVIFIIPTALTVITISYMLSLIKKFIFEIPEKIKKFKKT